MRKWGEHAPVRLVRRRPYWLRDRECGSLREHTREGTCDARAAAKEPGFLRRSRWLLPPVAATTATATCLKAKTKRRATAMATRKIAAREHTQPRARSRSAPKLGTAASVSRMPATTRASTAT